MLGIAADKLQGGEKLPLIWFVVLFPLLVLAAFYRLVTKHHGKLYAPADYKDDKSFLKTLPAEQQRARLEEEIVSTELYTAQPTHEAAAPPNIGDSSLQRESSPSSNDIRSQYLLAERLAVQKLEKEFRISFQTQVSFGEGRATAFDAVADEGDRFTAVEVKYLRKPNAIPAPFRDALYRAVPAYGLVAKRNENKGFRLVIAVVADFTDPEDIERVTRQISRVIADAPIPTELRVFKFEELKNEFKVGSDG